MSRFTFHRVLPVLLTVLVVVAGARPAADTPDEDFLTRLAATDRFRSGQPTSIRVTSDGSAILFLRSGPRDRVRRLFEFDPTAGRERLLADADTLGAGVAEPTAEELARRERQRVVADGIVSYDLSRDGRRVLIPLGDSIFVLDREGGAVVELRSEMGAAIDVRFSPDGLRFACVRDGDLYVTTIADGGERRLTRRDGSEIRNGESEFVAQEEMGRHHGYWWSPDSNRLLYQRTDTSGLSVMHVMDATRPDVEPRAWPYPRPGEPNADVRLGIVPVSGGATTWIEWDRIEYEYVAAVSWAAGAPPTVLVQNRRQTEQRLLAVDPADGTTQTLLVERDPAWLDLDENMPIWLPDGKRFLWTTQREGGWQIELRDRDGGEPRALNEPGLGLRKPDHWGLLPATGEIVVQIADEPTRSTLVRLSIDGSSPPRTLSETAGYDEIVSSGDGPLFVYRAARLGGSPQYRVADRTGHTLGVLASSAERAGFEPRVELTTVGDDPRWHAAIVRPRDFDTTRKYPVVLHVYGGPTSQTVLADDSKYLIDQWIADRGFVVVAIDGRGTPGRDRAWARAVRGDLISLPLEDQATALGLLGERYTELDLERVGVYGWSFGGYFTAMALARRPDRFHVGVAGAPVVDWRDYDTHYTERYMGLPAENPEGYARANVLTWAAQLERPLLVVHGTADDNVYLVHSLRLADALLRARRPFELLPLPGMTHQVREDAYVRVWHERLIETFERHLRPSATAGG